MTNKDLFKQAIAEAKTIREAAITNAKEALEESLTPHLKEMLAQKLQEMEEEDDKVDETVNNAEAEGYAENPSKHGNLDEAEEEEEETEEAPEGEEVEGEEEEELEIEDMTIDDLKDLIRDIVAQEAGHEEEEIETGEETPEGGEDMIGSEEEIDINELLAELEGVDKEEVKEETINEMGPEYIEGARQLVEIFPFLTMSSATLIIGALGAAGLTTFSVVVSKVMDMALAGKFGDTAKSFAEKLQKAGGIAARVTQNREGVEAVNEEEMEEGLGDAIKGGLDKFDKWIGSTSDKMTKAGESSKVVQAINKGVDKTVAAGQKVIPTGGWNAGRHLEEDQLEELNEALKAVKILRNQLQEVNLLNAKLLYVNKVFKANNLSEGQKVNVIAAFDKAETVREVKLVFETVSKNVVAKSAAIKEHKSFASKATGITAAPQKEVINEVSEQVLRMQKLAGIIK